jgi:FOG: GGDEF domain
VKECIADKSPLTICFIDMDDLKVINDNYGHKEGDFAIKGVADAISSSCGSMDVYGKIWR